MRRVQPIARTFRNQLRDFGLIPISRNWYFRRALYLLRRLNCLLGCKGEVVERTQAVPAVLTSIRIADTLAKITYVWNDGAQAATIYEDGKIVAIVGAGVRQRLAVSGRLALQAQTDTGSTSLRVQTFRRCLCGDVIPPYDDGIASMTGGQLI